MSLSHTAQWAQQNYPDNVYWGDTHLHTSLSLDGYTYGNTKLGPDQAYRFAKGEAVTSSSGLVAQLQRPLDFLVIADHASNMGLMQSLLKGSTIKNDDRAPWLKRLGLIEKNKAIDPEAYTQLVFSQAMDAFKKGPVLNPAAQRAVWANVSQKADAYNQPGLFTAFIAYEWTETLFNLHRVVIFKDNADITQQVLPFSQFDSDRPEKLWAYMADYEKTTGGEVLAIPHNGNLSQGVMFGLQDSNGNELSPDYAIARARWEPLVEVTQIKGDSETHPVISPADSFADFERIGMIKDWSSDEKKQRGKTHYDRWLKSRKKNDKRWPYQYGYARPALKQGLQQQASLGVNPFKFGMAGGTDSHTSLATADNNNFFGKLAWVEPNAERVTGSWFGPDIIAGPSMGYLSQGWRMGAAGYTAIWAKENTREALFAAMKRKEVYASTGPRITLRFFGGWDYQKDDAFTPNLAKTGYQKGVPMGGDLSQAPEGQAPVFLIHAVKDPDGAHLDRVQVIKGWRDAEGQLHEKIYHVALSDNRQPNWRGKIKPVGNTVNITDASYTNTIGDAELATVWQDPDFKSDQLAFYYLRVLEIPTPRWTAYDAKYFQLKDLPKTIPMITQERAYSSPIWYTP